MEHTLIEFYTPILEDLCKKFPKFKRYLQNPYDEIFGFDYEYDYKHGELEDMENAEEPIDFRKDVFSQDFKDYVEDTYNGVFVWGSYRVCFLCDKGLGNDWVLKFSRDEDCGDPCQIERELYCDAECAGLGELFAETTYLGELEVDGIITAPLFAAARYDIDEDYISGYESSMCYDDYHTDNYSRDDLNDHFDDENIVECFYDKYSIETLENLIEFLDENGIVDLHGANIGFDKYWNPVIIDYSFVR